MRSAFVLGLIGLLLSASVIAKQKVVLAAEDDWHPYSALRGDQVQGRSVDIVRAAYEAAEAELTLQVVPFKRGMVMTKEGIYAGVFNAGLNEEVLRDYLIPRNHIALSEQIAVARSGQPFKGKQSFNGKRLVLTNGYTYPVDITSDARNSIETVIAEVYCLRMIAAGRADFTIMDRLVFLSILAKEPALKQQLENVGPLHTEKIYVLFSQSDNGKKALSLFDQGMDTIQRNGVLKKIINSWEAKFR
jgi:polar amino acid transport system substrate-binding protein